MSRNFGPKYGPDKGGYMQDNKKGRGKFGAAFLMPF